MKKKLLATLLSAIMVITALTGCGGSGDTTESGSTTSSSEEELSVTEDATATESATLASIIADSDIYSADEVKTGGTLRIGTIQSPTIIGYTPEIANNSYIQYLRCAYESLLYYDIDGTLIGQLADSWETDTDANTLTFHLKEGVVFADGTDFNAEAVKFNMDLYKEVGRSETNYIDSVDIIDDYTIQVNLTEWNSSALESIGFFICYMSPTVYDTEGADWLRINSCGTGPYTVKSFDQGVSVKYVKNENYRIEGEPYLDGIEYTIFADTTTLENAMTANEIDVITYGNDVDLAEHLLSADGIITSKNENGLGVESTGLIPSSSDENDPFYDAKVRQAFCYAVDWDTLVTSLSYGIYTTTDQWAAPGAVTYNTDLAGYNYDPEKAKELLIEAGYPDGFETTIYTVNQGFYQNLATAASASLAEVGIIANVEIVDAAAMGTQMTEGWSGITWHFASIGPDLGLFMGRHLDPNGAYYAPGIRHPQDCLDLLDQIRSAKDDETKINLEWQLQEKIYDEYALFGKTLFVNPILYMRNDYVKGGQFGLVHAATWSPSTVWLDR
ncbi:MAG: ABC transporter substrate-binding protein [Lachnospiraceae bacterium]